MMRAMTSYKLVMPGDLNHYGFLFGGKMLMWVDEVAWMAVSGDYPGCNRDIIRQGAELVGLDLPAAIAVCIDGMKPYAAETGLLPKS